MGGARREGRPWSGAKGPVPEINAVAELLHQYMAEARLSLKDVHDKLAPEYFPPGTDLPTPRQFYDLLDGKKLTLELACAVIDICSGPDGDARIDAKRRDEVGELFRQAAREPRPSFRDLVTASEKMLSLRTSLESLQTAYEESTAARDTAQVVAVAMFGLLQQMQNTVSHLTRQRDQLRAEAEKQPVLSEEVQRLQDQLDQAQQRERDTQELLDTALKDKANADRTANEAAALIATQEAEIRRLKAAAEAAREALPAEDHMPLGVSEPVAFSGAPSRCRQPGTDRRGGHGRHARRRPSRHGAAFATVLRDNCGRCCEQGECLFPVRPYRRQRTGQAQVRLAPEGHRRTP
ncbi:hypothetical protein [Streptomyces vinaceus]|uniref:hypothetical protein n=1 Tax=Streptomyces vinaceus TaxID=1960 RepID=UPI0035DFCCA2